jgi:hypothetical protein
MRRRLGLWLGCLISVTPVPLAAQQGGLSGRTVVMHVVTYDDPAAPLFVGPDYAGKVTEGPEFGMIREGYDGMAVVPVLIDLSDDRIDLSYAQTDPGQFSVARFNGYVLQFPTDCVLIGGAAIDPRTTTLPLTDKSLTLTAQSLSINVQGLSFDHNSRIGITVSVMDCPVS